MLSSCQNGGILANLRALVSFDPLSHPVDWNVGQALACSKSLIWLPHKDTRITVFHGVSAAREREVVVIVIHLCPR